ncbi:MAG: hypothetical protein OJF47_004313 [Nitrospira sp.]|jgi:ribosomal protein S18 acetylase RimI-like enzyme|nr:MAG: hypothetical protein OJF47_004313 [Nitrospira sp.]
MSDLPQGHRVLPSARGLSIVPDAWLATIMNRNVHRVTGVLEEGQKNVVEELRLLTNQPGFVFARVATQEVRTSHWLEALGFRLVDTALLLEASGLSEVVTQGTRVRFATSEDQAAVLDIARCSFRYSRFHLDPCIPRTLADEIKAQWAGNYFSRQRGDHMAVAEQDGRVVGFLQLLVAADQVLIIDLIAVHPDHRGSGLAAEMIRFVFAACGRFRMIRAGTQSANLPSLALYHKLGFHVVESSHIFHYHKPARGQGDT